jgi:hypothetical protein
MIPSKHCDLCENKITSLINGVTCKLTKRKPDFKNTCSKIKLDKKFQEKLELINLELEGIKRNKNSIYWKFYTQILFGFILVVISIGFMKDYFGAIHYYFAYLMITAGFTLWTSAYVILNRYRKERKNIEFDKGKIDQLLQLYSIDYTSNVILKDKTHGVLELDVELKYTNWTKEYTTTSYKIN